jgi:hypothetical protein
MGIKCSFAHTLDEWNPIPCTSECTNTRCGYIHPYETKEEYAKRMRLNTSKLRTPIYIHYGTGSDSENETEKEWEEYKTDTLSDTEENQLIYKLVNDIPYYYIDDVTDLDLAIKMGQLEIVEDAYKKGEKCSSNGMELAAERGDFRMIVFLNLRGAECTPMVMNLAAKHNHMRILRYLHLEGKSCTSDAIDWAAQEGHLRIVQYLVFAKNLKFTEKAFETTHQDIIDFLMSTRQWHEEHGYKFDE